MIDDAIVDELAVAVQDRGIGRATWCDLLNVACCDAVDDVSRIRTCHMNLLEAGHIHQTCFGANRFIVRYRALGRVVIEPSGAHAVPVLKLAADFCVAMR